MADVLTAFLSADEVTDLLTRATAASTGWTPGRQHTGRWSHVPGAHIPPHVLGRHRRQRQRRIARSRRRAHAASYGEHADPLEPIQTAPRTSAAIATASVDTSVAVIITSAAGTAAAPAAETCTPARPASRAPA
ncbi:MAG TPA: hypothetical protein VM513_03355, partial [Kofleriaceae bacterium]|nr:hypothetical protein [Kofleriaceae bacterium]